MVSIPPANELLGRVCKEFGGPHSTSHHARLDHSVMSARNGACVLHDRPRRKWKGMILLDQRLRVRLSLKRHPRRTSQPARSTSVGSDRIGHTCKQKFQNTKPTFYRNPSGFRIYQLELKTIPRHKIPIEARLRPGCMNNSDHRPGILCTDWSLMKAIFLVSRAFLCYSVVMCMGCAMGLGIL